MAPNSVNHNIYKINIDIWASPHQESALAQDFPHPFDHTHTY
jgi:hypothetical protein